MQGRYELIRRPESAPLNSVQTNDEIGLQSKNYAAFLKKQERKVGPDGFVDSGRYSYTYQRKKAMKDESSSAGTGGGLDTPRFGLINLMDKVKTEEKHHEKSLKVIEDLMWQHKQQERELKRIEGDIVKNQQSVRHTLRDYENAVNKKKLGESKKLSHSLEKYTVLQQEHIHGKKRKTVERIRHSESTDQFNKDVGRKFDLKATHLARKYRSKMCEIDLKRTELLRLNQEYETKLQAKEAEQLRLKREAAELALSLNMETQKSRIQKSEAQKQKKEETKERIDDDRKTDMEFSSQLAKSDGDIKTTEAYKRRLSADLSRTKTRLDIKKRDENRHLIDTKIRLGNNINIQRELNEEAKNVELDKKVNRMNQNIKEHNSRSSNYLHSSLRDKKEKRDDQEAILEARFQKRYLEQQRREHHDTLNHCQKMVSRDEMLEQDLFNKVRSAEYNRQKQEQEVRRRELALAEMKRKNASKIKQEMMERQSQEMELERKILLEKSELNRFHSQREASYIKLQQHRQHFKNDKYLLTEHEREHSRLTRIGATSDLIAT